MFAGIREKEREILELCRKYRVMRLAIFGSALTSSFDHERSDLDFIVDFASMPASEHARAYLGLLQGLEQLFERKIDLLEESAVHNPYISREIQETREILYAA